MGRSVDSIQRYTAELEAAGLIVVERSKAYRTSPEGPYKRKWANRYHFVVHVLDHLRYKYWWGLAIYVVEDEATTFYETPADASPEPRSESASSNAPPSERGCESPQDDATSPANMSVDEKLANMREMMHKALAEQP
jgi:hypothetical protein